MPRAYITRWLAAAWLTCSASGFSPVIHACRSPRAASSIRSCCTEAPGPVEALPPPAEGGLDAAAREDNAFDLTMISLFRLAFGRAVGWQSRRKLADYDGLVDIASRLHRSAATEEERTQRVAALFSAFPQRPQLLQHNRWSCEGLAALSETLFPFLVGRCTVEKWQHAEGTSEEETWASKVVIERCRFLEASGCKGMCVGLCKRPSEAYFASLGLPVSFTPDFETGSCEMVWGRVPQEADLDGADLSCFRTCNVLSATRATPSVLRTTAPQACTYETIRPPPTPSDGGDDRVEAAVEVKPAGDGKGMGAFATEDIAAGAYVTTYVGELVTLLETQERYTDEDPVYLFELTPELYLDAMDSTHFSRYFNHDEKFNLNFTVLPGERRIDFFASRAVLAGEELTFDYGPSYWAISNFKPAPGTDSRTFEVPSIQEWVPKPAGPPPLTATNELADLDRTMALPAGEARSALLRTLEYYGATRLDETRMRVPFGIGEAAKWEELVVAEAPLDELRDAAAACITQASALKRDS